MSKEENRAETIDSLKLKALKVHFKYSVILAIIVSLVMGVVLGYFLSINVISNAQSTVVNSIKITSKAN